MSDFRIFISVEIEKSPKWADHSLARGYAHFENGLFTYAVLLYSGEDPDKWFSDYVAWPPLESSSYRLRDQE